MPRCKKCKNGFTHFCLDDISHLDKNVLSEIHQAINRFEWPEALGNKPDGWDRLTAYYRNPVAMQLLPSKYRVLIPVFTWIRLTLTA